MPGGRSHLGLPTGGRVRHKLGLSGRQHLSDGVVVARGAGHEPPNLVQILLHRRIDVSPRGSLNLSAVDHHIDEIEIGQLAEHAIGDPTGHPLPLGTQAAVHERGKGLAPNRKPQRPHGHQQASFHGADRKSRRRRNLGVCQTLEIR